MNFVNTEGYQLPNMFQRSLMSLPRETQYRNEVSQHIDTNSTRRRHMFQPPLMQPSNGVSQFNHPQTRQSSVGESSRLQVRNIVSPGPNPLIPPTAVNLTSNNVNMNTLTDRRRSDNNNSIPSVVQQENVPPLTTLTNNLAVQHNGTTSTASNNSVSMDQNQNNTNAANNNLNVKFFGSTENEKFFLFTGTVERVIKWNKIFQNHFCFFEVIASVISIQEGSMRTQKIMLLRDKKGPILQVIYYNITTHMDIEDFHVGQVLRCVGKMTAPNILNAVSIRTATREETETLQRLCLVCDHAITHFINA